MPLFLDKTDLPEDPNSLYDELLQSRNELFQIFETSFIGMAIVSLDGKWIRVNKYLCDLLGYSQTELVARSFNDVTHSDDKSLGLNKIAETLAGKINSFEIEKRYIHKDGSIIHVLVNSSVIKHLDGKPKYFVSQTKDITGIKNSMSALRLSEERFRLVFERAPIGLTHFDAAGNIIMVNKVLEDILGSTAEKITKINTRKDIHDPLQKHAFEEALSGRVGHFEGEYTSLTGNKTSFLKATYAPLFDLEGRVKGGIAITDDITLDKVQESKLINSLHEKELLLKEVYHRVKNNLQTIISLLNIQINESRNEEFIENIKETKNRLFAMSKVHEVLCTSDNFVSISLQHYLKNLVSNFEYPNITCNVKMNKDVSLNVDQTNSLGIIINELITNSTKHNPEKGLVITMAFDVAENNEMVFNYSDNGKGMSPSKTIFSDSLGMNLVTMLVENQLDGKLSFVQDKGFHLLIEFIILSSTR